MFKKPLVPVNRIPITVYDIDKRIQLKKRNHIVIFQHPNVPQNGSRPHTNLQPDINDLGQIPEKDYDRTSAVAHSQNQDKQTKTIINHLKRINRRIITVNGRYNQQHAYKKRWINVAAISLIMGKILILKTTFFTR